MSIRIDDLGASSKRYERWSHHSWANFWPAYDRRLFGAWGPYRELSVDELEDICEVTSRARKTITLAITAYWVKRNGSLLAYNRKFPGQAAIIAHYARRGVVEVAAHGMTHCVPGQHLHKWVGNNRYWHRDRAPWRAEAKRAIELWLDLPVTRFVEPGHIADMNMERYETVFHDREFILNWPGTIKRLMEALR
jgi:hypothetical protein